MHISGSLVISPWNLFRFQRIRPRVCYTVSQSGLLWTRQWTFYVYGSMHRWSILIIAKRDATQSSLSIILQVHSTCFGCQLHPPSGVHKTVTTASGTGQLPPSNVAKLVRRPWKEAAEQKIWPVPEAVVTVLFTPDNGCGWHRKHVEWTCRIINRLLCVASCWKIINMVMDT